MRIEIKAGSRISKNTSQQQWSTQSQYFNTDKKKKQPTHIETKALLSPRAAATLKLAKPGAGQTRNVY